MLPSQVASVAISKYGRKIQRVPLDQLSVASFNRAISPKYVHHRGLQIMTKDGFATSRYKYCMAFEANPANPLAGANRTNREAESSNGLLPPVTVTPRYELATKNHLWCFLMVLQHGHIRRDDNEQIIWKLPDDSDGMNQDLHETMERGLQCQILDKDICDEPSTSEVQTITGQGQGGRSTICRNQTMCQTRGGR